MIKESSRSVQKIGSIWVGSKIIGQNIKNKKKYIKIRYISLQLTIFLANFYTIYKDNSVNQATNTSRTLSLT